MITNRCIYVLDTKSKKMKLIYKKRDRVKQNPIQVTTKVYYNKGHYIGTGHLAQGLSSE